MLVKHNQLSNIRKKHKDKKIVICSGCFDMFHSGHLSSLNEAKANGDILVVVVLNDKEVKSLKGNNRPIIPEQQRAYIVDNIKSVDYVIISEPRVDIDKHISEYGITPDHKEQLLWREVVPIILSLKPDIVCTSPEVTKYASLQKLLKEKYIERKDYTNYIPGISTSEIIQKISCH